MLLLVPEADAPRLGEPDAGDAWGPPRAVLAVARDGVPGGHLPRVVLPATRTALPRHPVARRGRGLTWHPPDRRAAVPRGPWGGEGCQMTAAGGRGDDGSITAGVGGLSIGEGASIQPPG